MIHPGSTPAYRVSRNENVTYTFPYRIIAFPTHPKFSKIVSYLSFLLSSVHSRCCWLSLRRSKLSALGRTFPVRDKRSPTRYFLLFVETSSLPYCIVCRRRCIGAIIWIIRTKIAFFGPSGLQWSKLTSLWCLLAFLR